MIKQLRRLAGQWVDKRVIIKKINELVDTTNQRSQISVKGAGRVTQGPFGTAITINPKAADDPFAVTAFATNGDIPADSLVALSFYEPDNPFFPAGYRCILHQGDLWVHGTTGIVSQKIKNGEYGTAYIGGKPRFVRIPGLKDDADTWQGGNAFGPSPIIAQDGPPIVHSERGLLRYGPPVFTALSAEPKPPPFDDEGDTGNEEKYRDKYTVLVSWGATEEFLAFKLTDGPDGDDIYTAKRIQFLDAGSAGTFTDGEYKLFFYNITGELPTIVGTPIVLAKYLPWPSNPVNQYMFMAVAMAPWDITLEAAPAGTEKGGNFYIPPFAAWNLRPKVDIEH